MQIHMYISASAYMYIYIYLFGASVYMYICTYACMHAILQAKRHEQHLITGLIGAPCKGDSSNPKETAMDPTGPNSLHWGLKGFRGLLNGGSYQPVIEASDLLLISLLVCLSVRGALPSAHTECSKASIKRSIMEIRSVTPKPQTVDPRP